MPEETALRSCYDGFAAQLALRGARAGGEEVERAQLPDNIAAHLPAQGLRELAAADPRFDARRGSSEQ